MSANPLDADQDRRTRLLAAFSHLSAERFTIQSDRTDAYNCVAWAAGRATEWWWPDRFSFWPEGIAREATLSAFVAAFSTLGYIPCRSARHRRGVEKVALYVDSNGKPAHVARQLENGRWTSKLGKWEDIEHGFDGLTGHEHQEYGSIVLLMARPQSGRSSLFSILMRLPIVGRNLSLRVV